MLHGDLDQNVYHLHCQNAIDYQLTRTSTIAMLYSSHGDL